MSSQKEKHEIVRREALLIFRETSSELSMTVLMSTIHLV